ncbi:hypothetical protein [Emticicia agri]|uniref:DNA-binding protein n=1 Tax=Emticicia agri TaxID=2492393 RepID=A0A4Q5LU74_9BACT|nr:hypothetical protein [Emticicia agri]RYU92983.1 hypothetical protein EWM59_24405 [Emticicia agri]
MIKERIATKENVADFLKKANAQLEQMQNALHINGEAIMLGEFVTIKRYCQLFNIEDTQVVSNWIKRGIIPAENIREIEELNGIKLIKAVAYK